MDFKASRLMKSLGSLGRTKVVEPDAEFDVPADMAGRLARVREAALANEAQALHEHLPHMASGETADDQAQQVANDDRHEALDAAMTAFLKKIDATDGTPDEDESASTDLGTDESGAANDDTPPGTLAPMKVRDSNGPLVTIKWLASQDAAVWHYVASQWDWDWGVEPLMWMVKQSDCDAGTAAMLFWKSGADEHYLPFGDAEPTEDDDLLVAELAEKVAERFSADEFGPMRFAFDDTIVLPHFPSRLESLYVDERLDWDASKVPLRSSGELVLIDRFDKVTEEEIERLLSDQMALS